MTELPTSANRAERNAYLTWTFCIQVLLGIGLAVFIWRRDWQNVFLTVIVVGLTLLPVILDRQYRVIIPPEFQLISAAFVFLSLFLGSATDFYYKYWWWDIVLHTGSGFLLGIVGFIFLFVLNQTNRIPREMKPGFVCFFAVTFAVFLGVLWEIFEFIVDCFTTANMQSRETNVVDTMQDLIVDTLGAVVVALMGLAYVRRGQYSFIADGIRKFVQKNPKLFGKSDATENETA
jgi:hypothetical protein